VKKVKKILPNDPTVILDRVYRYGVVAQPQTTDSDWLVLMLSLPPKSKTPTDTLCAPLLGITEGVFSTSLLCEIHTNAGESCGAGKTFSGVDYNFKEIMWGTTFQTNANPFFSLLRMLTNFYNNISWF